MNRHFKLPDLGEGIHEGEIIAVLVSVGDQITEGDPILEIETDKASVEIPSPYTGNILEILVKPGDVVKVGDVLITFSNSGASEIELTAPVKLPEKTVRAPAESTLEIVSKQKDPVPASPATRRLARELKVDLHMVPASGPGGLVTSDDVRSFAATGKEMDKKSAENALLSLETASGNAMLPPLPDFSKWGLVERVPLRSIRRTTARQMALAWSQIPHVNCQDDVDVTALEALRRRHKKDIAAGGGRLTLTVFAVKAAAAALRQFPQFNASLDTATGEIVRKQYCHIGVATDSGDGLIVPIVRDADCKSITRIAGELNDLVERTRARKIKLGELQGGSFTITNIGAKGGRGHVFPIINYPEIAILGMGAARLQPVIREIEGTPETVVRLVMPVSLAIDHRVLDGVDAARFLAFFRNTLEDLEKMLLAIECPTT